MKRIGLLGVLLLVILLPRALFAATTVGSISAGSTGTAAKATALDTKALEAMIRPTLERYVTNHPNVQVRIWSMIILSHLKDIDQEQLITLPTLVQQMANPDENIRLIATESLRQSLELDQEEWVGVLTPVLRTTIKTSKYPEVKKIAIRSLGSLSQLDEKDMSSIPLLLELAQDEDPDIRSTAIATIEDILAKKSGGGGGAGPR